MNKKAVALTPVLLLAAVASHAGDWYSNVASVMGRVELLPDPVARRRSI